MDTDTPPSEKSGDMQEPHFDPNYEKYLALLEEQTYLMFVETNDGSRFDTYVSPLRVNLADLESWVEQVKSHFPQGGIIVFNNDGASPSTYHSYS